MWRSPVSTEQTDAQGTPEEVRSKPAREEQAPVAHGVTIAVPQGQIQGALVVPASATAVVVAGFPTADSRFAVSYRTLAAHLQEAGLATLLVDLLTVGEARADEYNGRYRFDTPALSARLALVLRWLQTQPETRTLPAGLFGAGLGAGAALMTAARHAEDVHAVVCAGGRPELAGAALAAVEAPTLLVVAAADEKGVSVNQEAFVRLSCQKQMEMVAEVSHVFAERRALQRVASLSIGWFRRFLLPVTTAG